MSNANQPFPEASVTEISPGAAFAQTGIADVPVIAGPSSKGPLNTPTLISDIATLTATFGTGDAVKKAAYLLARVAVAIVFVRMTTASVAGVLGSVTVTRTASGTAPTNTISGTPTWGADVVINYVLGGVTGTGPIDYQVSLDGGATFGATQHLLTGTSIVVLGVTLALGSGKTITTADTTAWLQTVGSSVLGPATTTGTGTALSSSIISGTAVDAYEFAIKFPVGGTVGASPNTITYSYTLDYGAPNPTWTPAAAWGTGTTLAINDGPISTEPTGLTLTLTGTATIVAGDIIAANTSPAAYDSAGATALGTALTASNAPAWTWVYLAGPVTETLAASVASMVDGWSSTAKPSWGVVDSRDRAGTETLAAWSARVDADYGPYTSTRVGVSKGRARGTCPITGRNNRRDAMMFLLARAAGAKGADISTDWGEFDLGPLDTDVSFTGPGNVRAEYDSFYDQNGVTMGFLALRSWPGVSGIFPATASLLGPDGNIKLIPIRRVFNVAQILGLQVMRLPVCQKFRQWKAGATPSPYVVGDIYEPDARNIERIGTEVLKAGVLNRGWCSDIAFVVTRTPISLGGGNWKLTAKEQMTPLIYIKESDATAQLVSASTPTG
jgi:hypothetical protein